MISYHRAEFGAFTGLFCHVFVWGQRDGDDDAVLLFRDGIIVGWVSIMTQHRVDIGASVSLLCHALAWRIELSLVVHDCDHI